MGQTAKSRTTVTIKSPPIATEPCRHEAARWRRR
jgi:hypothetical protein